MSRATEITYVGWIRRYIAFTGRRHPRDLGEREVGAFLTTLAVHGHVAASTQNQALAALQFLYTDVLEQPLAIGADVIRAKRPHRVPEVLSRNEVSAIIEQLTGLPWLVVLMLYGSGLRIGECLSLRVKDVDVNERVVTIRDGKGAKNRMTVLSNSVIAPLMIQLGSVRDLHARDKASNRVVVPLPDALARKYPSAARELGWQWLFPATRLLTRASNLTLKELGTLTMPVDGTMVRFHLHRGCASP